MTRLAKFEEAGPPEIPPREQRIRVRLRGGRTGKRALVCEELAVAGTTRPFGVEIWFGDRIAVLGGNGSGKSSFLRLLGGEPLAHAGTARLGARVVPGMFAQTHARPDLDGRTPVEILMTEHALLVNEAMSALARYELQVCARQAFGTLSGGQQAHRGHGARCHARPLVRPVFRPLPGLRLRRHGQGVCRAGVGLIHLSRTVPGFLRGRHSAKTPGDALHRVPPSE